MRDDDEGRGSPPPVLLFERRRRDRDPLAADVVQDVHLVRERSAREYLEDLERRLERGVRTLVHHLLDGGAGETRHEVPLEIRAKGIPKRLGPARRRPAPEPSAGAGVLASILKPHPGPRRAGPRRPPRPG